ncbi:MAG TPA: hypothetical protein PKO41_05855 [Dokdonella sp.]|uniref:hypothetical protein n=1 Tax=Dokdonella sp. TaxID=2291710 RepID=UPI0025BA13F7|nr:hypothetical protein [Dokdonella sp.]MBX3692870.1 hypothetical protein [Dokdonella sp.]MCW5566653.1 hypothetical protein [Dokdonella sp.]HNR91936.1 hypothetical protein [Dokdonella sp.]
MRTFAVLLLLCCTARPATAVMPVDEVDYRCNVDSDCVVKNVGNCCGHYPACVNRDSRVFPDRVKAECARKGLAGVCGFPNVEGCACVQHRCSNRVATTE